MMKDVVKCCIPFLIGVMIGVMLYTLVGWWGFLLIFPWIGFSITFGCLLVIKRKGIKKRLRTQDLPFNAFTFIFIVPWYLST